MSIGARRSETLAATRWVAFSALALGQLLVDVDDSVLNIALPTISNELHLGLGLLPWVVNAYVLCFGGLLMLGGRLADRWGQRRMLLVGVGLFVVASTGGALVTGAPGLLVARAGQGVAAAMLAPSAMSLLVSTFTDPAERARALGLWGAVTGAGALVGLLVGGAVTQSVGWRWLFAGNAVLAVLVGLSVRALLPEVRPLQAKRIEPLGALFTTAALVTGVHLLDVVREHGFTSGRVLVEASVVALLVMAATRAHRRAPDPFVPRALLRDRAVMVADGSALVIGAALLSTFFFLSLHLQQALGYTPFRTALAYVPMVVVLVLGAAGTSGLVARFGVRPLLATGMAVTALGLAMLAKNAVGDADASYSRCVLPGLLVTGLGLGVAFVALTVAAIPVLDAADANGAASGLYNTAAQVGGALGVAVLATVAHARTDYLVEHGRQVSAAVADGRSLALLAGSGILASGVLLAMLMPSGTGRATTATREGR